MSEVKETAQKTEKRMAESRGHLEITFAMHRPHVDGLMYLNIRIIFIAKIMDARKQRW